MEDMDENKRSVLLVEDDETFRKHLRETLVGLNWNVREAENGLVAQTVFDLNKDRFDLILSDVKMPEMDGVQLLTHIRASDKKVKFIMMTGFSEVIESKQAFDLGADEFLAKPFRLQGLRDAINLCFDPKPKAAEESGTDNLKYFRIPAEEFITSSKLQTDIYVKLGSSKYIKIAHAGDVVPLDRLKTYMEKKIDSFYVLPEDMRKIVGFNLTVSKIANSSAQVSRETRLKLFTQTAALIAQNCHYGGVDKNMLAVATETVDSTMKLAMEDDNLYMLMSVLQIDNPSIYAHSVAVSAYACMIGKKVGMGSLTAQFRLSLAGLLHDIGKRELPINVLSKTRLQMTAGELALLAGHCQRGKDILLGMPGIPEDIVMMVAQHHENNVGTGYPYGVAGNRIHPLAKILAVSEVFCTSVLTMGAKTPVEVQNVLQRIWNVQERELDVASLKALANIFSYDFKGAKTRLY
jgi:response regulator RpfG family c-di-GMP phosphodiesterase